MDLKKGDLVTLKDLKIIKKDHVGVVLEIRKDCCHVFWSDCQSMYWYKKRKTVKI